MRYEQGELDMDWDELGLDGRELGSASVIGVTAEPDDTPSDMDDGVCVSYGYLDLLIRKANAPTRLHCSTCHCAE